MTSGNTDLWSQLSLDLWVKILSSLSVDPNLAWVQRDSMKRFIREQSAKQRLRLVCKKTNQALEDSQLSRCLFVREDVPNDSIASLLQWTRRQRSSVQTLVAANGSPSLEAVLAALICDDTKLTSVYIVAASPPAIHIMPCYRNLKEVDLRGHGDRVFDLQPLQALVSLGKLCLQEGKFVGIDSLAHLTNLQVTDADVTASADCACVTVLSKLEVRNSHLKLHSQGLSACHGLRQLHLSECHIGATVSEDNFCLRSGQRAQLPVGMSALSALTDLDIVFTGHDVDEIGMAWIASLKSLQILGIHAQQYAEVPMCLSALTALTQLWLTTSDGCNGLEPYLYVQIDWQAMQALKQLFLGPGEFEFDSHFLHLVNCTGFERVAFDGIRPVSALSAMFMAAVTSSLAIRRPDVACFLDQVNA